MAKGPITRSRRLLADKLKAAQQAAQQAGQPFDLGAFTGKLSDDERDLMGLPRLRPSPSEVAGVATQFAGEYPQARTGDVRDFAAALMGTLPPVPFETTQPTGSIPSVTQFGPPSQAQLGPSRTELSQQKEFAFREKQTTEEAARQKEAGVASLSAQVSNITGLGPEDARKVAGYYFGEPAKGPLPKNLKALADFAQTHANLAATKALYLERLASMQSAGLEAQTNYLKLLHELAKNPQMDQAIGLLKDMKGAAAEQLKAALATQLFKSAGITQKDVAADPTGLKGIIEFIFGSFAQKIAPGDVSVPTPAGAAPGAAPGALPPAASTSAMAPDLAPFGLPAPIAKELGVAPGTEQTTIPGRTAPAVAPALTAAPGAGKRSESQASMAGLEKMAGAIQAGEPIPQHGGNAAPMTLSNLVEDYIAQYDMPEERAAQLRKQAAAVDARKGEAAKKEAGVKQGEAARDSLLQQLLAGASTAKDVVTVAHKLGEVASEHSGAIMKAAAQRIPEIARQRAKEAVAKELADAVLTFLKARKKAKVSGANRPEAAGNQ